MFNNIIYFIIVLLIFNISYPDGAPGDSIAYHGLMLILTWLVFLGYCRFGFHRLLYRFKEERGDGGLTGQYHGLILRLSILAIFLFALDVYMFHLKYWFKIIPVVKLFSVLQGILAITLFLFYLGTIWFFAHPAYTLIFRTNISRRAFIISNFKLNMPILFPWLLLSFVYDMISISPWSGLKSFLGKPEGQITFFAVFLSLLMIFMPRLIQYWWGCKPLEPSDRVRELKAFFEEKRFKYRDLLRWPIFEGRMMTAGIMGIIPRYRYILVTDALMEILSVEELKAVMAHEVGHARYRHLLFYIFFFLGYMVLAFGFFDISFYFFATQPFFMKMLGSGEFHETNMFYLLLSIPILISMFIYFRYVMGFFMRNFERQADLHSATIMGTPEPTIRSLEKIALLSGKSRDLPSWHHFSIKERVEYLWRMLKDQGLAKRHHRFVFFSFGVYLICITGLGYLLNFSPMKKTLEFHLISRALHQQIEKEPNNILLLQNLATLYQKMERYGDAINTYERILLLDKDQAVALNNLAWLLVTVPDEKLRDPKRALILAQTAVGLKPSPIFLDTLAEAYYVNGFIDKAIKTIKKAILLADEGVGYYEKQLRKFMGKRDERVKKYHSDDPWIGVRGRPG